MTSLEPKALYGLLMDLVSIPSITASRSGGENRAAEFIHSRLAELEYFRSNPECLRYLPCEGDPLGRKSVCALVRSPRPTKTTVILTGHFDVVDAEPYGPLKDLAFSPEELTGRVGELDIPDDAREDLASGHYLFGRGISDMKAGLAAEMGLLGDLSRSMDLPVNVLFLAVPDEENDSAGMRSAVKWLLRLGEKWDVEYSVCLNGEPSVGSDGVAVYLGTIGKIMPFYFFVGKESHVGAYYDGVSSALLMTHLSLLLEGAADTAERFQDQNFPPQTCLRFHDLVRNYSVTLPERAIAYYNILTVGKTPAMVLEDMRQTAEKALRRALAYLAEQRQALRVRGESIQEIPLHPRVLTFEELKKRALARGEDICRKVEAFAEGLPGPLDRRERAVGAVSYLLDLLGEKGPMIVVGFLPPYYPPRVNRGRSQGEKTLRTAVERLKETADARGVLLKEVPVFQGITDLSYLGFQGAPADLDAMEANMPLWGRGYDLPMAELKQLDIPVVNFGPKGKGEHKNSERIDLSFYLNVFPGLFRSFVEYLADVPAECRYKG